MARLNYGSMQKKPDGEAAKAETPAKETPAPAEAAAPAPADPAAAAPAAADPRAAMLAKHSAERKAMRKAHEAERKDYHGLHRDGARQMDDRQEKAIAAMDAAHDLDLTGGAEAEPAAPAVTPAATAEANATAGNE